MLKRIPLIVLTFCLASSLVLAQTGRLTLVQFNAKVKSLIAEQLVVNRDFQNKLQQVTSEPNINARIKKMIPIYVAFANANESLGKKYDAVKAPLNAEPVRKKMAQILHKIAKLTNAGVGAMRRNDASDMVRKGNAMTAYANLIEGEMVSAADKAGFDGRRFAQDGTLIKKH